MSTADYCVSHKDGISVIVIAYNEENYLPALLDSLSEQSWNHFEVIVVDSGSNDRTRNVALAYQQCFKAFTLVELHSARGPAFARNQGAKHARHERLLFLDADTVLQPEFLRNAIDSLTRSPADLATCLLRINEPSLLSSIGAPALNLLMLLLQPVYTTAYGACLFSTKEVHEAMGGFKEDLALCEDCEYVKRAQQSFRYHFRVLGMTFGASDRRARSEGTFRIVGKYIWAHMCRILTRNEIAAGRIAYEYGDYHE